jgi:hypothetical protein
MRSVHSSNGSFVGMGRLSIADACDKRICAPQRNATTREKKFNNAQLRHLGYFETQFFSLVNLDLRKTTVQCDGRQSNSFLSIPF